MSKDVCLNFFVVVVLSCSVGCVFCDPKEPIKVCTRFRARVLIFNIEVPITKGFPVSFCKNYVHGRLLRAFPLSLWPPEYETHSESRSGSVSPEETDSSVIFKCLDVTTVTVYEYFYWLLMYSWTILENVSSATARLQKLVFCGNVMMHLSVRYLLK